MRAGVPKAFVKAFAATAVYPGESASTPVVSHWSRRAGCSFDKFANHRRGRLAERARALSRA